MGSVHRPHSPPPHRPPHSSHNNLHQLLHPRRPVAAAATPRPVPPPRPALGRPYAVPQRCPSQRPRLPRRPHCGDLARRCTRPYAACDRHSVPTPPSHIPRSPPHLPPPPIHTFPQHQRRRPTAPIPPDGATCDLSAPALPHTAPFPLLPIRNRLHPTRSLTAQPHPTPYRGTHGDRSVATAPAPPAPPFPRATRPPRSKLLTETHRARHVGPATVGQFCDSW